MVYSICVILKVPHAITLLLIVLLVTIIESTISTSLAAYESIDKIGNNFRLWL